MRVALVAWLASRKAGALVLLPQLLLGWRSVRTDHFMAEKFGCDKDATKMESKAPAYPQHLVRPELSMLILCGLPGSGKSTLAARLETRGWIIVNQDRLGNRRACERSCQEALACGQRVVIDRCNHDSVQRSHWTRLAGSAVAVWLDADLALCVQRVLDRASHPTLPPNQKSADIVRRFARDFVPPSRSEPGITKVIRIPVPYAGNMNNVAHQLSPPRIPC